VQGQGNGPVDAFVAALAATFDLPVKVLDYHEHALAEGAQARAVAYLELRVGEDRSLFGVGIDANIVTASMKAVMSALMRSGVSLRGMAQMAVVVPRDTGVVTA
jgi:2-isopropylmalate synthase